MIDLPLGDVVMKHLKKRSDEDRYEIEFAEVLKPSTGEEWLLSQGFRKGELVTLAASTDAGKTMLGCNPIKQK